MSEMKTTLKVPAQYAQLLIDIRLLKSDGHNPNKMTIKQHEELWRSLQRHGWMSPIVADEELVFADGEQRAQVCIAHGEFYAPVLRAKITDNDRRMLRLKLNKLKGKHNKDQESEEYERLVKRGEKEALESMLTAIGERLPEGMMDDRGLRTSVPELYEIILECNGEAIQKVLFELFKKKSWSQEELRCFLEMLAEGLKARILTL